MPNLFWLSMMSETTKKDYVKDGLIYQGVPLSASPASVSFPNGVFTVEIVNELIAQAPTSSDYRVLLRMYNKSPGEYANQLGNLNNAGVMLFTVGGKQWTIPSSQLPLTYKTIGDKRTTTFVLDSNKDRSLYCNGEFEIQNTTLKTGLNRTELDNVFAMNNGVYYNYFDVRIYDRVLTPEEIAHNYEIDKERFLI